MVLLSAPFVLTFLGLQNNSACYDEPVHLPLGAAALERGWWDLAPSSPPLSNLIQDLHVHQDLKLPETKPPGAYPLAFHVLKTEGQQFPRLLDEARRGSLLILLALTLLVYAIAQRLWGTGVGAVAVLLTMPPIVAHGFLLGSDLLFALGFVGGVWVLRGVWLNPRWWPFAALVIALATLGKFTAGILLPGLLLVLALRKQWVGLALAPGVVLAVFQVFYGCPLDGWLPSGLVATYEQLKSDMDKNHSGFFLGEFREDHPLGYFPLLVLLKTPLSILAMGLLVWPVRERLRSRSFLALASAVGCYWLFMVASNAMLLGERFMLPAFVLVALAASVASKGRWKWGFWALWAVAAVELASDRGGQIGRFNQILWTEPEKVFADSAVDWGQDLKRLRRWQEGQNVGRLKVFCWGLVTPETYGVQTAPLSPPVTGDLVAVSRNLLAGSGASIPTPAGFAVIPPGAFADFESRFERVAEVGHGLIIFRTR